MFHKEISDKIIEYVRARPRTMQEIAQHIDKNWRTAERYVTILATETGMIGMYTFRGGTKGALKIVYLNALDRAKGSSYQERLFRNIELGRRKEDFSPFDIFQFVDPQKREAYIGNQEFSHNPHIRYESLLAQARQQVLFLSGNLSWVEEARIVRALQECARRGVKTKILTRVEIPGLPNTKKVLGINQRLGKDMIKIRHCEQPLRALIVDDDFFCIKEILSPALYREKELAERLIISYVIKEGEWVQWMQRVFWHLWEQSIDVEDRLSAIHSIANLPTVPLPRKK